MRFLVRVEPTFEAANKLDAAPGGPGPLFGYIGERYKPEAFYLASHNRLAFWVIDFADAAAITEFTHLCIAKAGCTPELIPAMSGEEAARAIPAAIAQAKKALA